VVRVVFFLLTSYSCQTLIISKNQNIKKARTTFEGSAGWSNRLLRLIAVERNEAGVWFADNLMNPTKVSIARVRLCGIESENLEIDAVVLLFDHNKWCTRDDVVSPL
jgi:hypothetical protein